MEDFLAVVPKARCGFLYAGMLQRCCALLCALTARILYGKPPHLLQGFLMATLALQQLTT